MIPRSGLVGIYVVSLADAAARRESVTRQFRDANLAFDWQDAVDGRAGVLGTRVDVNSGGQLSSPQIGCALSHRAVYEKLLASGAPGAFVFEDDITLSSDIAAWLASFQQHAHEISDRRYLIHGGGLDREYGVRIILGNTRLPFDRRVRKVTYARRALYGTFGYYVTAALARAILEAEPEACTVADAWESRMAAGVVDSAWICTPAICSHPLDMYDSDILDDETRRRQQARRELTGQAPVRVLKAAYRALLGVRSRAVATARTLRAAARR